MTDKSSAPAFSMGISRKSNLDKDNGMPGPGTYEKASSIKVENALSRLSISNIEYRRGRDSETIKHWLQVQANMTQKK